MNGRRVIFIGIMCGVFAIAYAVSAQKSTQIRLLPSSSSAVLSSHGVHKEANISCVSCHRSVQTSGRSTDRNIPLMENCASCHVEAVKKNAPWSTDCAMCHRKQDETFITRGKYPDANIKFSHRAHQKQLCENCHRIEVDAATVSVSMKTCYECHQAKKNASTSCRTCHLVTPDGRMKVQFESVKLFPPEWLTGPTHGAEWTGNHAETAGRNSAFCANCHLESQCQGCHTGRIRPKNIHPGDWLQTHGNHSTMDNHRCANCHRAQSFCLSCHRRAGVSPDAPSNKRSARPADFHRGAPAAQICRRARTNITSCVSCHSESSCTTCHANINPHPVGFSHRCKPLAKHNKRACAKCHQGNAERLCR
ncbi:MAG: cytochrome c3 family protein [Deltaproteobacteria bacterium]|nr:cytochrome c3 family protein [Deltaproteobacteria bacterium]MBN2670571.1 cytochrome c3 family protein [Deltaproteobacteria bacterium]